MNELTHMMPIIAPIILINLILIVVAIVDLVKIEQTNGPKWMWVLLVLFFQLIGPILYFVIGRRNN